MNFLHFLTHPTRHLVPHADAQRHSMATHEYESVHTDIASASSDEPPVNEILDAHVVTLDDHPARPGYHCVSLYDDNDYGDALQSDAAPTTSPFPSFFPPWNDYLSEDRRAYEYFTVPDSDPEDGRARKASHSAAGQKCNASSSSTARAGSCSAPRCAHDSAAEPIRCSVSELRTAPAGFVEFALDLEHSTSMRWRVWRRFSRLSNLHQYLVHTYGAIPQFPKKSWGILKDGHFLHRRKEALQKYFDIILGLGFARDTQVAAELGICPPETPVALRVVPPQLEIRQGSEADHIPVQEYRVTFSSEMSLPVSSLVDACGDITYCSLPFPEGVYTVSVEAINAFGKSDPISITVRLDSVQRSCASLLSPTSAHSAVPLHSPSHQRAVADNRASHGARRHSLSSTISASSQGKRDIKDK